MAKAITSKTESLTIRVPVGLMAELRSVAKARGISLAALVVERAAAVEDPGFSPRRVLAVFKGEPLASPVPTTLTGDAVGYRPKASWKPKSGA